LNERKQNGVEGIWRPERVDARWSCRVSKSLNEGGPKKNKSLSVKSGKSGKSKGFPSEGVMPKEWRRLETNV
jgi:hypothetical protein